MRNEGPMDTRLMRWLIAPFVLIAIAGCSDSSGPGEPEDLGVLLLPSGFYDGLTWTRDGTELVYIKTPADGPGTSALNAVNVSTLAVRQLVAPGTYISSVFRTGTGEWIYFGILPISGGNDQVSRVHPVSGIVEPLISTLATGYDVSMLISPDERFLVTGRRLFDLQTGAVTNLPPGVAAGFSPDGTKLLYYLEVPGTSNSVPTLISSADGSFQTLHSAGYLQLAHRWEGNSPQLLMTEFELSGGRNNYTYRISEMDGLSGSTRDIAQFSTTGYTSPYDMNWSADERTLAAWVNQGRKNLYVIRSGSDPVRVVSATPPPEAGPLGRPVLSPSGNSVAYYYYHPDDRRSLYLVSGF
jgi:hypothetical protein